MLKIRQMLIQDAVEVAKIEKECFSEPWSEQGFETSLSSGNASFLVAEDAGKIIGYVGMYVSFEEGEITNVAVTSSARRNHVGEKLLEALHGFATEHGMEKIFLEVRESNVPAIGLYQKMGYDSIGLRKNFYSFPVENAVLMQKNL